MSARRSRLLTRALPVVLLACIAFGLGLYLSGSNTRAERTLVAKFVTAWRQNRYEAMYATLSPASQGRISEVDFAAAYRKAEDTSTEKTLAPAGKIQISGKLARIPMVVRTRVFGTLHETLTLRLEGDGTHLEYASSSVFPGLRGTEVLSRTSELGSRGTLLAADGEPLAEGPNRTSTIPTVAGQIVGELGAIPEASAASYAAQGYPSDARVGQDGLELIFQKQLAGTPGGSLLAGSRLLAHVDPVDGSTVRTTIEPKMEEAALSAVGGAYAGMTVLNQKTGGIEAAVGLAFTDLQPPGSTFKIVTTAAALQDGIATPSTVYQYETQASIGGYVMQNAGGESCGGTLETAFATSCDTVFGPLGIQVGGKALVAAAERFGFNQPTNIPTALESQIPTAANIGNDTAVGSTAIGQGQLEASTLEIADVGAAIANGGRRPVPTLDAHATTKYVTATTPKVASEIQEMMIGVVNDADGTGRTAAIPGVTVAGKTGTAELANTANQQNDVKDTDAWFVGYAPHSSAGIVVCALYPANGYGADSAAPAVSQVLEAALGTSG